jgi:transposase
MRPDEVVAARFRIPDPMWERVEPLLPQRWRSKWGGRPPLPWRDVIDGLVSVLRTGCQWQAVPKAFASGSSVHRYSQRLVKQKGVDELWAIALLQYDDLVGLEGKWPSIDGAMPKSPLGGEQNRAESDRSGQAGDETQRGDRRQRRADWGGGRWGEPPRDAVGGGDGDERAAHGPRPGRRRAAARPRQRV